MAFVYKPQTPLSIKPNKTEAFIRDLRNNQVSKEYWKECASSKNVVSRENMKTLKKMARGEK